MIISALKKAKRGIFKIRNTLCIDSCYFQRSYSQEGEDLILNRLFEGQKNGFYVDVGAHHPKRFSNTYLFYKKGWRGINIDAMPGSMRLFNKHRPRDINIEQPISDQKQTLTFYIFNEPALNGFSKELSQQSDSNGAYCIISTKEIETVPLQEILEEHLPQGQGIDFLTIDVEGLDFQVLKSFDLQTYRPKAILIEMLGSNLSTLLKDDISVYLASFGYAFFAKTVNTVFFTRGDNA